jgi:hypothetical protein
MTVIEARRLERAAARREELEGEGGAGLGPAVSQRMTRPGVVSARGSEASAGLGERPIRAEAAPRGLSALICALARPLTGRRYRRARPPQSRLARQGEE